MAEDTRARLKQWLESGEVRLQPLTLPQRELWETSPVPPGDVANHICAFIRVRGKMTQADCIVTMQKVVDRQEVLRLSFLPGKTQPVQMIRASGTPNLTFREITEAQRAPEALEPLMEEIFREPFDMVRGPLYRAVLLTHGTDELIMVFAIHHAIADGWTLGVLVQDLVSAYAETVTGSRHKALPSVPMTCAAWDAAERSYWTAAEVEKRMGYWRPRLANIKRLWPRPKPLSAAAGKLKRRVCHFPPDLTAAVRATAKKTNATLFNVLLTGFQATLAQWTGENDIVVGTPVANRTKSAVKETMGYFAGVVPLRGLVDLSRPFTDSVRKVHEETMDSFAHAMPFAELARALGDSAKPGYNPIFDVRFALQNHPVPDVELPGISMKLRMRSTGTARFDLACEVTEEDNQLEVVWLSRPSIFSEDDVTKLHQMFGETLSRGCTATDRQPVAAAG